MTLVRKHAPQHANSHILYLFSVIAALSSSFPRAHACYIHGVDSGICMEQKDFIKRAPFCASVVKYPACVPKEYEWFPNHTLTKKDSWTRRTYVETVRRRVTIEARVVLPEDLNSYWEAGDDNTVKRFTDNPDCQQAYKNFLCFMNFPRCDDTGQSLILCRSVCENFFQACKYDSFLNRCYNPEYYGATYPEPETITDTLGLPIYTRAHLPGQPFRDILIDSETEEMKIVCTPSIPGGATSVFFHAGSFLMTLMSVVITAMIWTMRG